MNDSDRFVLLKTIKGIKDNVDKMAALGYDDKQYIRNEFSGYLKQLVDVVNTLHSESFCAMLDVKLIGIYLRIVIQDPF
jgi:hypothetical protein